MNLALFDLDHTLIPTDSDHEWGRFLVRQGVVDEDSYRRKNDEFYGHYKAGTLDIQAFLRFALAPLAANTRDRLETLRQNFMREVIDPVITPQARALVYKHIEAGDLCAVVTATNSFVTAPIVSAFGIKHLIATEPATVDGRPEAQFTGEVDGVPSFREGKITRVDAWLKGQGAHWDDFSTTYFYSDSINDLPLMEKSSEPIATNPDDRLREHAAAAGWRIMDLF
ncbi:histidinol-phosphatase [Cupriavidus numazuensis]|uniref:Phosphatase n=1 Tax=Cupriavidus numazuensis TaxID=221992 RepID=A0ABM8TCZ9_9BURK|nr:HAD family hydrolase [Cupriavidus numazuensis]CAG2136667.1 putative phosphatase [Cupriavidus numazuensis]